MKNPKEKSQELILKFGKDANIAVVGILDFLNESKKNNCFKINYYLDVLSFILKEKESKESVFLPNNTDFVLNKKNEASINPAGFNLEYLDFIFLKIDLKTFIPKNGFKCEKRLNIDGYSTTYTVENLLIVLYRFSKLDTCNPVILPYILQSDFQTFMTGKTYTINDSGNMTENFILHYLLNVIKNGFSYPIYFLYEK